MTGKLHGRHRRRRRRPRSRHKVCAPGQCHARRGVAAAAEELNELGSLRFSGSRRDVTSLFAGSMRLLLLLLACVCALVAASPGDRNPEYLQCVMQCRWSCSNVSRCAAASRRARGANALFPSV
jgi:hypothetical protein